MAILSGVSAWEMGPIATGFFIAFVFLVVGCFLDAIPAIIIVGTILDPLARSAGLDPVHFAMIGIVSLAFGLVTPPYGLCLLIACHVAGMPMKARAEGHDDHAPADAPRARPADRVAAGRAVHTQPGLAAVPELRHRPAASAPPALRQSGRSAFGDECPSPIGRRAGDA